jgi:hypothetical protein
MVEIDHWTALENVRTTFMEATLSGRLVGATLPP